MLNKIFILLLMVSTQSFGQEIDWQGHRGARGILPENTLPAFKKALELGVKTLELDVVISRDLKVIVSHDPWMTPEFCLTPEGEAIPKDADLPNLFQMSYKEIERYDCGSIGNSKFPDQEKIRTSKPLLSEVFKLAEKYCKDKMRNEIYYNIEIKSNPTWDGKYQPEYEEFCDIVYNTIDAYVPWKRVNIQSFDHRILQYFNEKYPDVRLALLEESNSNVEEVIEELGFSPEIYSPYYKLMKPKKVKWLHDNGLKVIVWTVNTTEDMKDMINMGVDGIITDYPNYISEIK